MSDSHLQADIFSRTERLIGADGLRRLNETRVIIFGLGGVGSWTAEALIRSGIGSITLVDADCVATSNINRQSIAFLSTVGRSKAELLRDRLLDINPAAGIIARHELYTSETASSFLLDDYDYVIDAIDSLKDKALLQINACRSRARLVASMGAALKMDPTRIRVDEFRNVKGCRLAAALRNKYKRSGVWPARKFKCVWSDELLPNQGIETSDSSGAMLFGKVSFNGAMCHITAIFGFTLAGLVIESALSPR